MQSWLCTCPSARAHPRTLVRRFFKGIRSKGLLRARKTGVQNDLPFSAPALFFFPHPPCSQTQRNLYRPSCIPTITRFGIDARYMSLREDATLHRHNQNSNNNKAVNRYDRDKGAEGEEEAGGSQRCVTARPGFPASARSRRRRR